MEINNRLTTTIQHNFFTGVQGIFNMLDEYFLKDIITMDNIELNINDAKSYCTVPQAQALFSFMDLMGFLITSDSKKNQTAKNINRFLDYSIVDFLDYSIIKDKHMRQLLIHIYRNGIIHQYLPKSPYWGITKDVTSKDGLFVENSLNVKHLTIIVKDTYSKIKDKTANSKELSDCINDNWYSLQKNDLDDVLKKVILTYDAKNSCEFMVAIRNLSPIQVSFDIHISKVEYFEQKINTNSLRKYIQKENIEVEKNHYFTEYHTFKIKVKTSEAAQKIVNEVCAENNPNFNDKIFWDCILKDDANYRIYSYDIKAKFYGEIKANIIHKNKNHEIFKNKKSALAGTIFFLKLHQNEIEKFKSYSHCRVPYSFEVICRDRYFDVEALNLLNSIIEKESSIPIEEIWYVLKGSISRKWTEEMIETFKPYLELNQWERKTYYGFSLSKILFEEWRSLVTKDEIGVSYEAIQKRKELPNNLDEIYCENSAHINDERNWWIPTYSRLPISKCLNVTLNDLVKYQAELEKEFFFLSWGNDSWSREGYYTKACVNGFGALMFNPHFKVTDDIFMFLKKVKVIYVVHTRDYGYGLSELKESMINYQGEGWKSEGQFDLTSNYIFDNFNNLKPFFKDVTLFRPFIDKFFDDEFIKSYLDVLKQFVDDEEEEYIQKLSDTLPTSNRNRETIRFL